MRGDARKRRERMTAQHNKPSTRTPKDDPDGARFNAFMEARNPAEAARIYASLFTRHSDALLAHVLRGYGATLSRDTCKDIVQDVFAKLFEKRTTTPTFRIDADRGNFRTYLFRCGMNLALNVIQGTQHTIDDPVDLPADDDQPQNEERIANIAQYKLLFMRFLVDDPVIYDDLYLLSGQYMHDIGYDLLAEKTGLKSGTARVRCFRLLDRLRLYMHAHGLRF
jgi:DNA-directed RNA polymerase specialized sigma24 family protein